MTETSSIVFQNLFSKLRSESFGTNEELVPMSQYKHRQMVKFYDSAMMSPVQYDEHETYHLVNALQEKRRERIFDEERHAIDTSIESLKLLNLIIYNIYCFNDHGVNLRGIILIGKYLREKGHLVDYVKLDAWIKRLYVRRMASLLSSVLFYIFNFEKDELPFMYRKYKGVEQMICDQIEETSQTGRIQRKKATNLRYSPLSSVGNAWQRVRTALNNIEE